MFIIYSLLDDYSGEVNHIEREPDTESFQKIRFCVDKSQPVARAGMNDKAILRQLVAKNAWLEEENRLIKEELNELYLSYDQLSAAFGEMRHFIREAASVPGRYWREGEEA